MSWVPPVRAPVRLGEDRPRSAADGNIASRVRDKGMGRDPANHKGGNVTGWVRDKRL